MSTEPIPPYVHFIFGLSDDAAQREFGFSHYVAVHAAHQHLQPATLLLHYRHLPQGEWWERARPLVTLRLAPEISSVFGRPLAHAAHRADVLRLRLLIELGGIYLDMDVVVVRPFDELLHAGHDFVMGKEGDEGAGGLHGLCNAVMISRPNASFALRWLDAYRTFGTLDGDAWSHHSVQLPAQLWRQHPAEIRVLPHTAFFWPDWHEDTLRALFLERSDALDHAAFAFHLWGSLAQKFVLSSWSPVYLSSVPSSLNCLLQRRLPALTQAVRPRLMRGAVSRNCSCAAGGVGGGGGGGGGLIERRQGRQRHAQPVAHWRLQPAVADADADDTDDADDADARLLLDSSGNCHHGWIYGGGCGGVSASLSGCWVAGRGLAGATGEAMSLSYAASLEAFAPLPARLLGGGEGEGGEGGDDEAGGEGFSVSWWARLDATRAGCVGGGALWSLVFADGAVTAMLEPLGEEEGGAGGVGGVGGVRPAIRSSRRAAPASLSPRVALSGSDGWHHYLLSASRAAGRLELFVDGASLASAAWRGARAHSPLRGVWVGGTAVPLTRRSPAAPCPATRRGQLLSIEGLALFARALTPAQLPAACLHPDPAWRAAPVRSLARESWPDAAATAASELLGPWLLPRTAADAAAAAAFAQCPACTGHEPAPLSPLPTRLLTSPPAAILPGLASVALLLACVAEPRVGRFVRRLARRGVVLRNRKV